MADEQTEVSKVEKTSESPVALPLADRFDPNEGLDEPIDDKGDTDGDEPSEEEADESDAEPEGDEGEGGDESESEEEEASDAEESEDEVDEDAVEQLRKAIEGDTENKKEETVSGKKLKVRVDGKDIEVPPNATFLQKVDGKKQVVTVREALDAFASKASTERERSALERERNLFKGQNEQFTKVIGDFAKLASEGKAIQAMSGLIEATGQNSLNVLRKLRNELTEKAQVWLNMSPEERRQLELEEEAEYHKSETERLKKADQAKNTQAILDSRIAKAVSDYQVGSRERFELLIPHAKAYLQQEIANGLQSPDVVLTPEYVGQYAERIRLTQVMNEAIREAAPELRNDSDFQARIAKAVITFKPTKKELKEVISELKASENGAVKRVNGKLSPKKRAALRKPARTIDDIEDVDPGLDINKTPNVSRVRFS